MEKFEKFLPKKEKIVIKQNVECGSCNDVNFLHLFGVVDVEKYIFLPCEYQELRVFFLEKKYPFAVLLLECDDCPKPHREDKEEC